MGIISGIGNIYFVYQFIKKLVTPFEKTDAFKLGIIDKNGKILKKRRDLEGSKEKEAYTLSDTLIWNIKKLMGKNVTGLALTMVKDGKNQLKTITIWI